jgi:hypothetical protein
MLTKAPNGEPWDFDDLLSAMDSRVVTLSDLAEMVGLRDDASFQSQTFANALSNLRDDWEVFEEALRAWNMREHPEDYADEPTPTKGRAR